MNRLTVIISQGQSQNPAKRKLEENIASELASDAEVDLVVIPHLYDLHADGAVLSALKRVPGHMIVLSWLYSRAAHWLLDRNAVRGQAGEIELTYGDDDEDDAPQADDQTPRVIDERELPDRFIFCLDLRASGRALDFVTETHRISQELKTANLLQWITGDPAEAPMARYLDPGNGQSGSSTGGTPTQLAEAGGRRWYPVIDYSRCTNCMECVDFCLFGVYGIDQQETILVEQPDNCRKGCPACSRVCPENAIIFPQHKTPAIAGAPASVGSLKIDLSKLFGAPEESSDAFEVAARERDEQLLLAGREAVGLTVGVPKRQEGKVTAANDELDDLIDELDQLD